jgi:hypothetical protein
MADLTKIGEAISKLDPNSHTHLVDNQLPSVYDAGQAGATITASVTSTGEKFPAEGSLRALQDSASTRWLLGTLSRWHEYGPGEGGGEFNGEYQSVGGLQIKVDDGSFNIEFPQHESVQALVMGTTVIGSAADTQYVISVNAFWLH